MIFQISFFQNRLFSVFMQPECGIVEGVDTLADKIGVLGCDLAGIFALASLFYIMEKSLIRTFYNRVYKCSVRLYQSVVNLFGIEHMPCQLV